MNNSTYMLHWNGPFRWYDAAGASVFDQLVAQQSGIYIWAIKYQNEYLAYYVDETGAIFANRLQAHLQNYLIGRYRIHEPALFAQGQQQSYGLVFATTTHIRRCRGKCNAAANESSLWDAAA